jgi:hypothetical protein
MGLMGAAVTDHPHIEQILDNLLKMGAEISVSSLRIAPYPRHTGETGQGQAENITIAPEAGPKDCASL